MTMPIAARRPHATTHHGIVRDDPYDWLRDPGYPTVADPDILAHLAAENAYFEAWLAPHAPLVDTLFAELRGRVKDDDAGVPVRDGDFDYWWRFEPGGQYRVWLRRPVTGGDDAVILSEPIEAAGKEYFRLAGISVSPDGRLAAWTADDDGSERFKLFVRDLATGTDTLVATTAIGIAVWTADSRALAWTDVNDQWRPFRVRLHRLGSGEPGATLYEEADASFFVALDRSTDRSHFLVTAADHVTSEVRLIATTDPFAPPVVVSPRRTGREYDVDVRGNTLFVRTNDTHVNFRLATAPLARPGDWTDLIPGDDRVYLRGVTAFTSYLAISDRVDGLDGVRLRCADGRDRRIAFPEASYTVSIASNPEPDAPHLRLSYSSLVTPTTVFDYDVAADRLITRKVEDVPSGYDASRYRTERLMAPASDGTLIPVSVVYPAGFPRDGSGKLYLYGYGAYGLAIPPSFSASRLSLLDRGVAFAIAHIRGGDDMGYRWYLDGKLEQRTNTFTDFVASAHALIAAGFARPGAIAIAGGSAGGTLMGVVANTDPELWAAVVAHVPFVDVLGTMLDGSLPLTPIEWPEWGNPIESAAVYAQIAAYSPYDNVAAQAYPPILITAGLNDPRVTYWEPAKWAAKLRATKTDANPVLLKTNMGAGHGGKSGRFEALHETAEEFAFVLAAFAAKDVALPKETAMRLTLFAAATLVAVPVPATPAPSRPAFAEADIGPLLDGPQRSPANRARDRYRHPVETLAFFGLKPTMTVVEITPSAGWYTELLAPYLRDRGHYIAAGSFPGTEGGAKAVAKFRAKLDADPGSYANVRVTTFAKDHYDIAPPGSADMVLTFRNIHNFYIGGYAPQAFAAFYAALKPGGVLGIEEHRLPEDKSDAMQDSSGYMKVSTVRRLAEAAGFRFVAASEVNGNSRDTHDWPKGVWTLPPTFDNGDTDRAKYAAVGESDRMTLKFVKP